MSNSFFRLSALLGLLGLLAIIALLGPLPQLGVNLDLETGLVTQVIAGSAAAQAGMFPGDRVIAIYGAIPGRRSTPGSGCSRFPGNREHQHRLC